MAPPERPAILEGLRKTVKELLSKDLPIIVEMVEYDKIAEKCGECPDYLPVGMPARLITIDGLACPCAGNFLSSILWLMIKVPMYQERLKSGKLQ